MTLENSEIYNFADDNAISVISKEKQALLASLEKDSEIGSKKILLIGLGEIMIVNPEKFQSMILQRSGNSDGHTIKIDGNKIKTTNSVDLFGIHIDINQLLMIIYSPCATSLLAIKCNRSIETLFW